MTNALLMHVSRPQRDFASRQDIIIVLASPAVWGADAPIARAVISLRSASKRNQGQLRVLPILRLCLCLWRLRWILASGLDSYASLYLDWDAGPLQQQKNPSVTLPSTGDACPIHAL